MSILVAAKAFLKFLRLSGRTRVICASLLVSMFGAGCEHSTGPRLVVTNPRGVAIWSAEQPSTGFHRLCEPAGPVRCTAEVATIHQLLGGDMIVRVVRDADGRVTVPRTWENCLLCDDPVVLMSREGVIAPQRHYPEGPFVHVTHGVSSTEVRIRIGIRVDRKTQISITFVVAASNVRAGEPIPQH